NRHRSKVTRNPGGKLALFWVNSEGKLAWFQILKNPGNPRPKPAQEDLWANLSLVLRNFLRLGKRSRQQEMASSNEENEVYAEVETFYM
uniref:Uncharacterized protein n=1 Tax=Cannabis sativa TaxID=3483 RepID=A0A803QSJ0_CANSA